MSIDQPEGKDPVAGLVQENGRLRQALAESRLRERAAVAEARRQQARLEGFLEQIPAAVCVLDGPDMIFERVNPAFGQLYPGRELLGKSVREALPEIARGPFYAVLENIYRTGEAFEGKEVPFPLARREGGPLEEVYFDFIYQPRFNAQRGVDGIFAFGYEVTSQVLARKQVEESRRALGESKDRFQGAVAAIEGILWTNNAKGEMVGEQPGWGALTGQSYADYQGYGWARAVHAEDAQATVDAWNQAVADQKPFVFEHRVRKHDGQWGWFSIRAIPLPDEQGRIREWVGVHTEVTRQREAEEALHRLAQELAAANEELQAANEEIQAANEELSQSNLRLTRINDDLDNFVYAASHDLKAPILNIEGLLKRLDKQFSAETRQNPVVGQIYQFLYGSVDRFKTTINDLTQVARIAKEGTEDVWAVAPAEVLAEVIQDLQPQIGETRAQVETQLECQAVLFSRKNLKSVLYNLVSNALKYRSPDREPRVKISCRPEDGYQVLTVQDNGLGMDMRQEDKIFALFKRLHNHVEGTGIGLYIVKKMVENAGGKIGVESQVGVGSTFRVYFKES
jgi:PAS domain S-box-containing protein